MGISIRPRLLDRPHIRRIPGGVFVPDSWQNTAYPDGPIAGYYRVPCGFKLSRHIRVPREHSPFPDDLALPFHVYPNLLLPSAFVEGARTKVCPAASSRIPASVEIKAACLYKTLDSSTLALMYSREAFKGCVESIGVFEDERVWRD